MKFKGLIFLIIGAFLLCAFQDKKAVNLTKLKALIDEWHKDAADAKLESYFAKTTDDFVFLGTAPGEIWPKEQFYAFCKPYFDKGKAWDFKAKNRNWHFSADKKTAWFDEELDTWMTGCRGAGVCTFSKGEWKIAYYNLTVLIENEKINAFIKLREEEIK